MSSPLKFLNNNLVTMEAEVSVNEAVHSEAGIPPVNSKNTKAKRKKRLSKENLNYGASTNTVQDRGSSVLTSRVGDGRKIIVSNISKVSTKRCSSRKSIFCCVSAVSMLISMSILGNLVLLSGQLYELDGLNVMPSGIRQVIEILSRSTV